MTNIISSHSHPLSIKHPLSGPWYVCNPCILYTLNHGFWEIFKIWMQERLSHVAWDQINPWWLWMGFLMGFLMGSLMGFNVSKVSCWDFHGRLMGVHQPAKGFCRYGKLDGSEIGGIHPVYGNLMRKMMMIDWNTIRRIVILWHTQQPLVIWHCFKVGQLPTAAGKNSSQDGFQLDCSIFQEFSSMGQSSQNSWESWIFNPQILGIIMV